MKLFAVLLFVAVASAQISQQRQNSLDALFKLRENIPDFQYAQDSAILRVSQAKQKATDALNNFYHSVFETKMNSLQSILTVEAETLSYGKMIDDWCWESNIPMLQGIMGWIGTDYSECIKQLDNSIGDIVATAYGQFHEDESTISKYSLFEVFQKRNIINNPQSIIDAISKLRFDVNDAVPEFDTVIISFQDDLEAKLPVYSGCLTQRLNLRKQQIETLKTETERCLAEQA